MSLRIHGPGLPAEGKILYPHEDFDEGDFSKLLEPGGHAMFTGGGNVITWRGGDGSPFSFTWTPPRKG